MEKLKVKPEKRVLGEKTECLIAIGAATGANCIPCFEYLYEKAITTAISLAEIKRATEIASQVKNGAHAALTNSIDELIESEEKQKLSCEQPADKSCCF